MRHTKVTDVSGKLNWKGEDKKDHMMQTNYEGDGKKTPMDKPMPSQEMMMNNANETKKPKKVEKHAV